jgi:serine protease Do
MRPDLEKTPLGYEAEFFFQLAARARGGLVALGPEGATGVLVEEGVALTSIAVADGVARETGSPRVLGADGRLGLAAVAVDAGGGSFPLPAVDPGKLHPASYLAAVSIGPDAGFRVVPAHLASARRDSVAGAQLLDVPLPPSVSLAAVVTLDRELVGVAVRSPEGTRVLSADSALAVARALAQGRPCRGLEVAALPVAARQALGLREGAVVEKVWASAFGVGPGIEAGDILLAWGGTKLDGPEAFRRAYDEGEPGRLVAYTLWKEGGPRAGRVELPGRDCRPARPPREVSALGARLVWTDGSAAGLRVLDAPPGTPGVAAGLTPGDLVLAVGGRRLSWPAARRALPSGRPARPLVLTIQRGEQVLLLVVPSAGG